MARIFPDLGPDEYEGLRESIRQHGVLSPVRVDSAGLLVDGRHREKAAAELGIECPAESVPSGMDPWNYARTINLDRRNLGPQQRVAVLLKAEQEGLAPEVTQIREEAEERKQATQAKPDEGKVGGADVGPTAQASGQIGSLVGVGKSTVKEVERAVRAAGPEALDLIERGEKSAQQIVKEADRELKEQVQTEFFPKPVPVYDAWWKASRTIIQKVRVDKLEEEWDAEQRRAIIEWTPRMVERLNELERLARERPALQGVEGGRA